MDIFQIYHPTLKVNQNFLSFMFPLSWEHFIKQNVVDISGRLSKNVMSHLGCPHTSGTSYRQFRQLTICAWLCATTDGTYIYDSDSLDQF
jgi:hypothetical protein